MWPTLVTRGAEQPTVVVGGSRKSLIDLMQLVRLHQSSLELSALLFVVGLFHYVTLMRTPAPFVDEAWYASRAWSLIQTGRNFSTLDSGVFDRFDGYWTYLPLLGTWVQSLSIRIFGLSLWSVRLVSLLFGLIVLVAVYSIACRLGGSRFGLLAVVIASLSKAFLYSAHLARQDVMVAALGFGAVALYFYDAPSRVPWKSLLGGLFVGLSFEIHPYGLLYALVVTSLYFLDDRWRFLLRRNFWLFAIGTGAGLAVYVAIHVLPYPSTYVALSQLASGGLYTPPLLVLDPTVWIQSVLDMRLIFTRGAILLIACSGVILWWNRSRADERLLVLFATMLVLFVALVRNKGDYYQILLYPASDLIVAAAIAKLLWRKAEIAFPNYLALAFMIGLSTVVIARGLRPVLQNSTAEFQPTLARINAVIPAGSSVMGSQTYWFGMPGATYFSWEEVIYYRRYAPGATFEDALKTFHPQYLIIDRHLDSFIVGQSDPSHSYYESQMMVPRSELQQILDRRAQRVVVIHTETFGDIRIYALHWDD